MDKFVSKKKGDGDSKKSDGRPSFIFGAPSLFNVPSSTPAAAIAGRFAFTPPIAAGKGDGAAGRDIFVFGSGQHEKYLIGARAYYTETLHHPNIEGLELLYSDESSTKCGNCELDRMSDVMPFDKDEHIIGIDFRKVPAKCVCRSRNRVIALCLYTSHPKGRRIAFQCNLGSSSGHDDEAEEFFADYDSWPFKTLAIGGGNGDEDGYLPFIGVYDNIVGEVGNEYTCKRGMRVTGIEMRHGKITSMNQEKIPVGRNDEWWKESLGYRPNKHLKLQNKKAEEFPYLVGVAACYLPKTERYGNNYIVGLQLYHSDGKVIEWGRTKGTESTEQFPFSTEVQHEHIIGIDFDSDGGRSYYSDDDDDDDDDDEGGVTSLTLYTSHYGGKSVTFSDDYRGCGMCAEEDGGTYVGLYPPRDDDNDESKCRFYSYRTPSKKYVCRRGNRVTGITFKHNTITGMTQDAIPVGQSEKWWERSMNYNSDRDPEREEKRRLSRAKWQREDANAKPDSYSESDSDDEESDASEFDEEKQDRMFAEVQRQQQLILQGYEPEYDSDGNFHPHSGGRGRRNGYYEDYERDEYEPGKSWLNDDYDSGCCGFSERDCEDLLDQGVKPWDDDAGSVLGALRGW